MIADRSLLWATVATILSMMPANAAFGKRHLHVDVYQDDQLVLKTYYQDDGDAGAASVWRYLGDKPLSADIADFAAGDDNPLKATLEGDLRIVVEHASTRIAEAEPTKLTLVRAAKDSNQWFLPTEEVERTAELAGLELPPPKKAISVILMAILLLGAVAIFFCGCMAGRLPAATMRYQAYGGNLPVSIFGNFPVKALMYATRSCSSCGVRFSLTIFSLK